MDHWFFFFKVIHPFLERSGGSFTLSIVLAAGEAGHPESSFPPLLGFRRAPGGSETLAHLGRKSSEDDFPSIAGHESTNPLHPDPGWFDRTQEYLARRRGEDFGTYQYATREALELSTLPCWKHLTPEQRQRLAAAMVSDIEVEAAERRERAGVQALGPAALLAQTLLLDLEVSPPGPPANDLGPVPRLGRARSAAVHR